LLSFCQSEWIEGVSVWLTVNRQKAKNQPSAVNRPKRTIFTVDRQMSELKLGVNFFKSYFYFVNILKSFCNILLFFSKCF